MEKKEKFFQLTNYIGKFKRIFNPRYANEGDIHVWEDDHIEWDKIDSMMLAANFQKVLQNYSSSNAKTVDTKFKQCLANNT